MEYDARDASDQDPVEKSMKIGQEISEIQQKQRIKGGISSFLATGHEGR